MRWPSGLPVAPHTGGCGAWSGFGSTRRFGSCQCLPENSASSSVQHVTMWPTASCHISRVWFGWRPKPSISMRVEERPVPNSTRPSESRSSTAALSAERTGWL